MNFATPGEFGQVFGNGLFTANRMLNQDGLAKQAYDQSSTAREAANRKAGLANMFEEQTMADRVEAKTLENLHQKAQTRGTSANAENMEMNNEVRRPGLEEEGVAARRKQALSISDDEIAGRKNQATQWMTSGDPQLMAKGAKFFQGLPSYMEARQKHQEEMDKVRYMEGQQTGRALEDRMSREGIAQLNANSREGLAAVKAGAGAAQPKTAEQARVRQIMSSDLPESVKEDLIMELYNAQLKAKTMGQTTGITGAIDPEGKVGIGNKPGAPQVSGRINPPAGAKPPVEPTPRLKADAPALDSVLKQYANSGKTEAEIREAYFKKFGVN